MSFFKVVLVIVAVSLSFLTYAETKEIDIDLRDKENSELVKFTITNYLYYYVDKKACICVGWFNGISTGAIECKKLKVYPEIAKHLTNCK
jgi:hypothetical protein